MPRPSSDTHPLLSAINALVTGAIAAFIYVRIAAHSNELWSGVHFHPLNYAAMFFVCGANTLAFFSWLKAWRPVRKWKGLLAGLLVAVAGSFLCSLVMGLGTGRVSDLLGATLFFIPLSALVGAVAGFLLAHLVAGEA
ncbi:hypothetical protein [Holophaga foetida]|uniref:hypothetical protein n=1 Tax=Holophaga foetida TaxID=35839 RepID=UPI00024742F2|nr:hypothetical protein [Holophaga foetida]